MFRIVATLATIVIVCATGVVSQRAASSGIDEASLKAHVKYLADDKLEGRGTGAPGGEMAAKYIAEQLKAIGAKGAADGSFFQPVSLVGVKAFPNTTMTVVGANGSETLKFADDFVVFNGAQARIVELKGSDMVFVGYGIDAPEQRWDDYKGVKDWTGRILVMLVNDPPATAAEPNLFGGKALTYYGRWTYKFEEAARRGAIGAILIHTNESAGYPWSVVRTSNGSWRFDIARTDDKTPYLPIRSWMTEDAARRLMNLAGQDLDALRARAGRRDFQPVRLNLTGKLSLKSEVKELTAPNVVGVIEGSDPQLRNEYVVYTAHWDHLGVGAPNKNGDTIYNGALDNATGVASVLEIAKNLAKNRPKRSSLFLFTTAEEQGLLGAEWYVKHPVVPLDKTVANVNLDSMNILNPTHDFIPLGAERSTLKAVVDAVAKNMGMRVSPDARPEQGSFYRSDHFPFAKAGVPSISLKEGSDYVGRSKEWGEEQFRAYNSAHYHQPSDEMRDSWDFRALIQSAEIALAIGRMISDMPEKPQFNPDDEFAKKPASR